MGMRQENEILYIQNARCFFGPFQHPSQATKVPTFAVSHGRIRHSLELLSRGGDIGEKIVWIVKNR